MTKATNRFHRSVSAAQWRERYAELCREYPDTPPERALTRAELDRIRQWEQFQYALTNPPPNRWRVVRLPADQDAAVKAVAGYLVGDGA